MKDTVYFSEQGKTIDSLLNRNKIYAGQAPEVFRLGRYYEANKALLPEKILSINGPVMEKPAQLEAMLSYAETLAAPFTHARVDFFLVGEQIVFGEVTFTNGAGFDPITPREFDLEMGSWLQLPKR